MDNDPGNLGETMPTDQADTDWTEIDNTSNKDNEESVEVASVKPEITKDQVKNKKSPLKIILAIAMPILIIGVVAYYFIINDDTNSVKAALANYARTPNNSLVINANITAGKSDSNISGVKISSKIDYNNAKQFYWKSDAKITDDNKTSNVADLEIAGDMSKSTYYGKINHLKFVSSFVNISKLYDKWYKIDPKAVEEINNDKESAEKFNKVSTCLGNLAYSGSGADYWKLALNTHYFTVKYDGKDNDGTIYKLSNDSSKYKEFTDKLVKTSLIKKAYKCAKIASETMTEKEFTNSIINSNEQYKNVTPTIKLWISGIFQKKLTKVEASIGKDQDLENIDGIKITAKITNKKPSIKLPNKTESTESLKKALRSLFYPDTPPSEDDSDIYSDEQN